MAERVIAYYRVSTEEQGSRHTIENQRHEVQIACQSKGYDLVAEFADQGISGTIPMQHRPAGQRLLEFLSSDSASRVIVFSPDRLAGHVVEAGLAIRAFKSCGATADFVAHSFEDTPEGEALFNMLSLFAHYERQVIARRTHSGRERSVRDGRYIAGPIAPYGYRKTVGGVLEPNPETADVVRKIYEWVAKDDLGIKAVVSRLQERGVPPPCPAFHARKGDGWRSITVYNILTHPRYLGTNYYGKARVPMKCPALVDGATADAVRAALKRHRVAPAKKTSASE